MLNSNSFCPPEIGRVRKDMYNDTVNGGMFNGRDMEELPEAIGPVAQLQEKLYVPVKEYPDVSVDKSMTSDLLRGVSVYFIRSPNPLSVTDRLPESQ